MIPKNLVRIFSVFVLLTLAQIAAAQKDSRPFIHNGYTRPYIVYRPAHLASHPAVVFMLGGIHSTALSESEEFGWMQVADRNGFLVVFPELVATHPDQPSDKKNITFWEMQGSRTHQLAPGALPVDDDGYLMAVLHDVLHRDQPDPNRVFFAGFSSGSGMVQLLAARHSKEISAIVAVATPLLEPPVQLARPVPVLYIHGDKDAMFSGFEANSPHFATTPHGNWVMWGYLNHCQIQKAEKTDWGVRFYWEGCKNQVPVKAYFVKDLGHEWAGSLDLRTNNIDARSLKPSEDPASLNFTEMAWQFFAAIHSKAATAHP